MDPDPQSPGESVLRQRWIDLGLVRPLCQVPVLGPNAVTWRIDMGLPEKKFGAEYAGEQFHGPEHQEHDAWRRSWLRREEGWTIVVARKHNVYGQQQGIDGLLLAGAAQAGITLK